jgi:hypothetical protein
MVLLLLRSHDASASIGIDKMVVDDDFDYATENQVFVHLEVHDHNGQPASHRMIEILVPGSGANVIERATTDDDGVFEAVINVPDHLDEVIVRTNVFGIANEAHLSVAGDQIEHMFE